MPLVFWAEDILIIVFRFQKIRSFDDGAMVPIGRLVECVRNISSDKTGASLLIIYMITEISG